LCSSVLGERTTKSFFVAEYAADTAIMTNFVLDQGSNSGSECVGINRNGEHIFAIGSFNGSSVKLGNQVYVYAITDWLVCGVYVYVCG
jgi:hypothetical protein